MLILSGIDSQLKKKDGNRPKINEDVYKKSNDLQNVFTKTSSTALKKLNEEGIEIYKNILKSPNFKNNKAIRGEIKFSIYE